MALKFTKEGDKEFLLANIDDADAFIKNEDIEGLLIPLNELIAAKGMDDAGNLTELGVRAQDIYDRLLYKNTKDFDEQKSEV